MTPQERKVMELALEALEKIATVNAMDYEYQRWARENLAAIKEALAQPEQDQDEVDIRSRLYQRIHELETQLAQPEQEPVAFIDEQGALRYYKPSDFNQCEYGGLVRLYKEKT